MAVRGLDFVLGYEDAAWTCRHEEEVIKKSELDDLDEILLQFIKKKYPAGLYQVNMHFDMQNIPRWLHQYMPHYFNRKLIVEVK
jgi:hypothetical protein